MFQMFYKVFFFHVCFFNSFLCIICVTGQGTCTEGLCEKRIIFFLSNKPKIWIESHFVYVLVWFELIHKTKVIKQVMDFWMQQQHQGICKNIYLQITLNFNIYVSERACRSSLAKNRNEARGVDPQWFWTLVKLMQRPWTQQKQASQTITVVKSDK